MKAVVAAFNQEKALVGAFSVITNLRMELFQALVHTTSRCRLVEGVLFSVIGLFGFLGNTLSIIVLISPQVNLNHQECS